MEPNAQSKSGRINEMLADLARFGARPDGGIDRPAWSPPCINAENWLMAKMEEAGMTARRDGAGNIIGRIGGPGPALAIGSHIDTVPGGGAFDGALGVLAGIETVMRLVDENVPLYAPIEVIAFSDEEGSAIDLFGSQAIAGLLNEAAIRSACDRNGTPLVDHLRSIGSSVSDVLLATRSKTDFLAYLELHIEQGQRLESGGFDVGIVKGIPGIARCDFEFIGAQAHAGAATMEARRDALRGAASLIHSVFEGIDLSNNEARLTFGEIEISPNVLNVVPGRARVRQEIRAAESKTCSELRRASISIARHQASRTGTSLKVNHLNDDSHAVMDSSWNDRIAQSAQDLGLSTCEMLSWASHDSQVMAQRWPSALFFVPSRDGVSHHPDEYTSPKQIERGVSVLFETVRSWQLSMGNEPK